MTALDVTAGASGDVTKQRRSDDDERERADRWRESRVDRRRGGWSGFTSRIITVPDGDLAEDKIVTAAAGSNSATATLTGVGAMGDADGDVRGGFGPVPTVSSVSPNSGATAGGTSVTITGTNFAAGATVTFGRRQRRTWWW